MLIKIALGVVGVVLALLLPARFRRLVAFAALVASAALVLLAVAAAFWVFAPGALKVIVGCFLVAGVSVEVFERFLRS